MTPDENAPPYQVEKLPHGWIAEHLPCLARSRRELASSQPNGEPIELVDGGQGKTAVTTWSKPNNVVGQTLIKLIAGGDRRG